MGSHEDAAAETRRLASLRHGTLMQATQFDRFADEYAQMHRQSIAASGEAPEFFAEYKVRTVRRNVDAGAAATRSPLRILDFGTGVGGSIPWFARYFPDAALTGVDVSQRSLDIARGRFPDIATFVGFDGTTLPFAAAQFDIAFAAGVFHHIDHGRHGDSLRELHRVLAPGGRLFVFEHNPRNPLTVRAVRDCAFDDDAVLVGAGAMRARLTDAGFAGVATRYCLFFPRLLRALRPLEQKLGWCPLGAQYYVSGRRP